MDTAAAASPERPSLLSGAITLLLDALAIAAVIWGVPWIAAQLTLESPLTALLVLAAYLAMCAGLALVRFVQPAVPPQIKIGLPELDSNRGEKAQGAKPDGELATGCAMGLAVPFAVFVIYMLVESSGLLSENGGWLDEVTARPGMETLLSVLGILLFILVLGLFPWALLYKPVPRFAGGSARGVLLKTLAVLGGNAMVLVTAAHWHMQLGDLEPMGLAIGGRILVFICAYVVFLLFFAPPRLALIGIEGSRASLATYLVMLAALVWPLTA